MSTRAVRLPLSAVACAVIHRPSLTPTTRPVPEPSSGMARPATFLMTVWTTGAGGCRALGNRKPFRPIEKDPLWPRRALTSEDVFEAHIGRVGAVSTPWPANVALAKADDLLRRALTRA